MTARRRGRPRLPFPQRHAPRPADQIDRARRGRRLSGSLGARSIDRRSQLNTWRCAVATCSDLAAWVAHWVAWRSGMARREAHRRQVFHCCTSARSRIRLRKRSVRRTGGRRLFGRFAPPAYLAAGSRDGLHTPPPWLLRTTEVREFDLSVIDTTLEVAGRPELHGMGVRRNGARSYRACHGGRAALKITLRNHTHAPHSVHFHGAHDVSQDGLGRVAQRRRPILRIRGRTRGTASLPLPHPALRAARRQGHVRGDDRRSARAATGRARNPAVSVRLRHRRRRKE